MGFEDLIRERGVRGGQIKVFADFVFVEHTPELHADRRLSLECAACDAISGLIEFEGGRLQQRLASMRSKLRELRITIPRLSK